MSEEHKHNEHKPEHKPGHHETHEQHKPVEHHAENLHEKSKKTDVEFIAQVIIISILQNSMSKGID